MPGRYDDQSDILDYILGITYEIWEERGVDLIRKYYADNVVVYALGGISRGVDAVIASTQAMLTAFPDRRLLGENVIWSDDAEGKLSSHRILSPMTNTGASAYGPATGRNVVVRTVADCWVQGGEITLEWLVRDTLPVVEQLGFDPVTVARTEAQAKNAETLAWHESEIARVRQAQPAAGQMEALACAVLQALWCSGDRAVLEEHYAHYAVAHPGPQSLCSGINEIAAHYAALREAFAEACVAVDHVAVQPWAGTGMDVAVRWSVAAKHAGAYQGLSASGRDVHLLGVTHWRIVQQRIAAEWTVFDGIGALSQLVR